MPNDANTNVVYVQPSPYIPFVRKTSLLEDADRRDARMYEIQINLDNLIANAPQSMFDPLNPLGARLRHLRDCPFSAGLQESETRKFHVAVKLASLAAGAVGAFIFFESAPGATQVLIDYFSDISTFAAGVVDYFGGSWQASVDLDAFNILFNAEGGFFPALFNGAISLESLSFASSMAITVTICGALGAILANTVLNYTFVEMQIRNCISFFRAEHQDWKYALSVGLVSVGSQLMFSIPGIGKYTPTEHALNVASFGVGTLLMVNGTETVWERIKIGYRNMLAAHKGLKEGYRQEVLNFSMGELPINKLSDRALSILKGEFKEALDQAFIRVISAPPEGVDLKNMSRSQRDAAQIQVVVERINFIADCDILSDSLRKLREGDNLSGEEKALFWARLLKVGSKLPPMEVEQVGKTSLAASMIAIAGQSGFLLSSAGWIWETGNAHFPLPVTILGLCLLIVGAIPLTMLSRMSGEKFAKTFWGTKAGQKTAAGVVLPSWLFNVTFIIFLIIAAWSFPGTIHSQGKVVAQIKSWVPGDNLFVLFISIVLQTLYYGVAGFGGAMLFNGMLSILGIFAAVAQLYYSFSCNADKTGARILEFEDILKERLVELQKGSREKFEELWEENEENEENKALRRTYGEWRRTTREEPLSIRRIRSSEESSDGSDDNINIFNEVTPLLQRNNLSAPRRGLFERCWGWCGGGDKEDNNTFQRVTYEL